MKLMPQELRTLQMPVIVLALVLACVAVMVYFAHELKTETETALRAQESQLNQARQRYQSSGQEKETIVRYLPVYQRLISEGFIGEERRIEWVDSLRTIHQENKLFGINYSIGVQEAYKPAFNLNPGSMSLSRSVMKLELAMLHEDDLLVLLEELQARRITPFLVRRCEIARLPAAGFDKFVPHLKANCELDWLTAREPVMLGGKP
jgi:hypothetical protein